METDHYGDPSLHGHSGPVLARRFDYSELTWVACRFYRDCKGVGFSEIDDFNGAEQFGVGRLPMNIDKNGTRLSTALTYLTDEVWRRDNLTIRGETLVNTVRFKQRRATGVRLVGGKRSRPTRSSLPQEHLDRRLFSCGGQDLDPRLILLSLALPLSPIYPWVGTTWSSLQTSFCTPPPLARSARRSQWYRRCSRRAVAVARTGRRTCRSSPPTLRGSPVPPREAPPFR